MAVMAMSWRAEKLDIPHAILKKADLIGKNQIIPGHNGSMWV